MLKLYTIFIFKISLFNLNELIHEIDFGAKR